MSTTLEYTLFAILFLTNMYLLWAVDTQKKINGFIIESLKSLVNTTDTAIKSIKILNEKCKKDH